MDPSNSTLTSCRRRLKVEIITDIRSQQHHRSTSRHQRISSHELINYMYQLTAERPFGLPYQAIGKLEILFQITCQHSAELFCHAMNWTELNWTELNWSRPVVLRYLTVCCVVLPRLYLQCLTVHVPHFISRLWSSIMSLWMEMSLWDSWVEDERERERLGVQTERFRDIGVTIDDDLLPIDYDIVLSSATPEWKSSNWWQSAFKRYQV
jgi:hypothetical protein